LDHEIAYQSSASALVMMRNAARDRAPSKAVAVFADPVFESDDPRLPGTPSKDDVATKPQQDELVFQQAFRDAGVSWAGRRIPRLLASRQEAMAVLQFASGDRNREALDFTADKANATNPELRDYRIIHFATHGVFDNEHPELSGLLLSRFDPLGRQKEGFLRLDDIYNLELSADLVVLSACNTGLGKDVKGEGLIGLVRGFIYAGTSRVVASLWKVDDDATAELMKNFYRQMLQERRSPSAALREAQLAMWHKQRWRAPYYWAAFVMQGEYSGTIDVGQRGSSRFPWYLPAIGLLVVLFIAIAIRRVYTHR
jgi:CHAT domain-containing protein